MTKNRPYQNKERISFFINDNLLQKVNKVCRESNSTLSDTVRKALKTYVNTYECKKIEKELEEGYTANYEYYLKMQEEWKNADKE